jgi:hypothetical protein
MKLNNTKKINKAFDPIRHWYQLLFVVFTIFTSIVVYGFYSFFYIKNEILAIELESKNNVQNANSPEFLEKSQNNNKFLKDINNLNKILDEFEKKEIEYNRLINSEVKVIVNISTTTSASSTVATSTQ